MADKKRTDELDWADVRTLLELARRGSLSAAARSLNVTHATISRRVERLEQALGHVLFMREQGRYVLTTEGKRIVELAAPMEESAQAITRASSGLIQGLSGPVRITATEAVAVKLVTPAIVALNREHPRIEINLKVSNKVLSLERGDADIALRLTRPEPNPNMRNIPICAVNYHLYCTRDYEMASDKDPALYIGYPEELAQWPEAMALQRHMANGRVVTRTDHLTSRVALARAGMGIALLPRFIAEEYPELIRISNAVPVMAREVNVLVHADIAEVPRIRVCVNALVSLIEAKRHLIE